MLPSGRKDWELTPNSGGMFRIMTYAHRGVLAEFITAEISYGVTKGQTREEVLGKAVEYLYERGIYQYPDLIRSNKPLLVLVREEIVNLPPIAEYPQTPEESFKTPKPNTKLLLL